MDNKDTKRKWTELRESASHAARLWDVGMRWGTDALKVIADKRALVEAEADMEGAVGALTDYTTEELAARVF